MNESSENAPEKAIEQPQSIRDTLSRTGESMRGVGNIFLKRLDKGYYPLLSRDSATKINIAATSIEAASPQTPEDFERVAESFNAMATEFEKYGQERPSGGIHDDSESLRGLAAYARQAQNEVRTLQQTMSRDHADISADAVRSSERLAGTLEQVSIRSVRTAEKIDGYLRGR